MNYAALLGVIAAAAFTLPGLALLAEALGLHRNAGVATSLGVALLVAAGWFMRARRANRTAAREQPPESKPTISGGIFLTGSSSSPAELLNVKEEASGKR